MFLKIIINYFTSTHKIFILCKNLCRSLLINAENIIHNDESIPISSLSNLTGFPTEFIKRELLLENSPISLGDLRKSILNYLERNLAILAEPKQHS